MADKTIYAWNAINTRFEPVTLASLRTTINLALQNVAVLTDAASITTDASSANHFVVTLSGNRTLANPTNLADGQTYTWEFIQDAAGSRTITLGNLFSFGTDITAVMLSLAAGKRDFMECIYRNSKLYVVRFVKGY